MVFDRLMALSKSKGKRYDDEQSNIFKTKFPFILNSDNQKWWDKSIETEGCYYKQSITLNVEITAYALLALQSMAGNDSKCLPILKWLLNQRNDQGGFEGTQDTIVGIEALASFASKIVTKGNKVDIDVSTCTGTKFGFAVNAANALVLQSQKVCTQSR